MVTPEQTCGFYSILAAEQRMEVIIIIYVHAVAVGYLKGKCITYTSRIVLRKHQNG
jgi:hypothetical protein